MKLITSILFALALVGCTQGQVDCEKNKDAAACQDANAGGAGNEENK